jgi:small subunit ribosomal protein S8
MSMQDPISDMLVRIKNGQMAKHREVSMPSSKMKCAIAKVLQQEGFIYSFHVDEQAKPQLKVVLKYHNEKPVIDTIKRISKPGLRKFTSVDQIPKVKDGLGVALISTSKGVMTGMQAKSMGYGGEIICFVA